MKLFAIYDRKAEGHKPPFSVMTIGEAERAFGDACRSEGTDLNLHPEDYQLWMIGSFDIYSGELTADRTHVCNGTSRFDEVSNSGVMPMRRVEDA